jgi:hypothetical protein
MRPALLLVCATLAVSALSSCKHAYNETDFSIALAKHHSNLRWGRIENAALMVDPQLRAAFVAEWIGRQRSIELQEVEVAGMTTSEDGDVADVMLRIVYVEKDSMSVREVVVPEQWRRTSDGWLAVKPATLEVRAPEAMPDAAPPAGG